MVIRCTGKLLKLLKVSASALGSVEPSPEDWYANLVWFDRRKCLLVTHAGTLFSVFVPDVRAPELKGFGSLVIGHIERALAVEGLPADTFGDLREEAILLAKTASRQVLGCMSDLAWMLECDLTDQGGLAAADLAAVNRRLRRQINSPTGYAYPVELAAARVGIRPFNSGMQPTAKRVTFRDEDGIG